MVNVAEAARIEEVLLAAYPHLRVDPGTGAQGAPAVASAATAGAAVAPVSGSGTGVVA